MCAPNDTVLFYENIEPKEKISEKELHFN